MTLSILKHKWHKITLGALVFIVAIIMALGFYFDEHWSPILRDKMRAEILKGTDSLYKADFASAEFHLLQGKIVIFNITLKGDSAVFSRLKKRGIAPNNLVDLHVRRLVITHIHPFKLYFQRIIDFDKIVVSAPEIHISYQLNHTKDTVTSKDNRTVWQKISKTFHSVHVGDIFLNDVKFRYDDYSGNKVDISTLKEMNLHANDLLIDSTTQTEKSRFLFCRDIVTELNNYTGKTSNGLYTYTVKYLKLSSFTSQLNAEDITLSPVKANVFFDQSHKDKYSAHLDSLQLNSFDFLTYHKYRKFAASNLILNGGTFSLFSNPNGIKTNTDKIKSFPNMVLANMKLDMKMDTVSVRHINVNYTELNRKSKKTGTISFNNTNGHFFNITNNQEALKKNNFSTARLTTYFMGKGELSLLINFNLTDKDAAYSYKGTLAAMDLKYVNPATMPLGMVKINAGTLKQLDFDFKANSKVANGKVTVLYNDLKVTVLKPDTEDDKLKRQTIASLYANIFIIKHNNPDNVGDVPRSFNVNYPREINVPFFKYTWQSLLTGIKPCVGFDKKKQEVTKAMVANSVIKKQDRIIKREERKQRRAERKEKRETRKMLKNYKTPDLDNS